jgi:hypothetical protein
LDQREKNSLRVYVFRFALGLHQENAVREYQKKLGEQMLAKVANFREDVRPEVQAASDYILKPPVNLFLQALTTFDVLHHVISRATTFFSQRKPYELGSFSWIVDGKDPAKVTRWEEWWAHYAQGALATRIFHSFYLAKERTLSTLLPIPTSSMKAFQATGD